MPITKASTSKDQEKFLVNQLLSRSYIKLVMDAVCENLTMREGSGDTAFMVRYKRMNVPVAALTEGITPTQGNFDVEEVAVTLDQWGDFVILTDVSKLTTKHPLLQQAQILLADNAARILDREITLVLLAGTNIQFWDGSVASRATIQSSMIMNNDVIGKAVITLAMGGASPIGGLRQDAKKNEDTTYLNNMEYIAIIGPHVKQEILRPSVNFGSFIQNNVYNQKGSGVTMGAVGKWMGCMWIETNFIPVFTLFGNKTVAAAVGAVYGGMAGVTLAASAAGGALVSASTYGIKIVRRNKLRGFPENISIGHTTSPAAANTRFTLTFDNNYYYDVYFAGPGLIADSDLRLIGVGYTNQTINIDAPSVSTITAPANIRAAGDANDPSAVHIVFICGDSAVAWAGFYKPEFIISSDIATVEDPLKQRRSVGFKFYGKAVIKNNDFMMRAEMACSYSAPFS